jgi:hypothetical protein
VHRLTTPSGPTAHFAWTHAERVVVSQLIVCCRVDHGIASTIGFWLVQKDRPGSLQRAGKRAGTGATCLWVSFGVLIVKNESPMTLIVLIVNYVLGLVRSRTARRVRIGLDQSSDTPRLAPAAVLPVAGRALAPPRGVPPNSPLSHPRYAPPGRQR